MIQRRYPAALGGLAAALGVLTVLATSQAAVLAERVNAWYLESTGPVAQADMEEIYRLSVLGNALQQITQWMVLAALIAGIGALALLVLRGRAQAGSASATASREASAAFSRS